MTFTCNAVFLNSLQRYFYLNIPLSLDPVKTVVDHAVILRGPVWEDHLSRNTVHNKNAKGVKMTMRPVDCTDRKTLQLKLVNIPS